MKLEPVRDWILGFAMLHRKQDGMIILPSSKKGVTRCYLIESVGPEAETAGYKRGDIVVAFKVYDQIFYGGAFHRVTFQLGDIIQRVHDVSLDEFTDIDGKPIADSLTGVPELVDAALAIGKGERAA